MTLPNTYTLTINQGETLARWWRLEHTDGTVVDLNTEGYTIGRLQVRDAYASEGGELLLNLTTDNGGVVIDYQADADGTYWSGALYMHATATAALVPWGDAVFDLEIENASGEVIRVLQGVAVLDPEATA
jgi:hypothetical protein